MKLYKFIAILVTGSLISSCNDEFLDLQPISSATTETFYKNADDIKNAVSGAYASLQAGGISTNNYVFGEVRSDNTVPVASGSVTDQDEFDRFYIRTTNPFIAGRWNDGYRAISRCNTILERIGAITLDENLKNRYIAETKFIRGLVYFELVRTYGDVPLILKEIRSPDEGYEYGRTPAAEVYAQIEKDLTEAEAVLPVLYTGGDLGRATKGAAKALLSKVYLTQKEYAPAATKFKEVIDLGIYSILPNYSEVFKVNNENNREIIFDIQFKAGGVGEGNPWPNAFAPENSGNVVIAFGGGGNNQPTADLVSAYESNDLRRDVSLATSYTNASGQSIPYNFVRKYYDVPATNGDNNNNIPVIRYADVLLMYAEALNEIGYQPAGEAFTYLNQIRSRAGLPALMATEVPDQQAFRLTMERERRVELAFEGHRWFDLVRTGRAIEVMNSKKDQIKLVRPLTQNDLVFPVPQSQIDINKEKIQQNPGY